MFLNHLGLEEGIKNLEMMILQSSSQKMGIDWHLAYEELRRITQTMKLGMAKSKRKKKKRAKGKFTYSYISVEEVDLASA